MKDGGDTVIGVGNYADGDTKPWCCVFLLPAPQLLKERKNIGVEGISLRGREAVKQLRYDPLRKGFGGRYKG